jgi:hypothetical protein
VFVLIPLGLYGVLSLLTLRPKFAAKARYRPGSAWDYEPMWWTGNPEGIGLPSQQAPAQPAGTTARGGARGNW